MIALISSANIQLIREYFHVVNPYNYVDIFQFVLTPSYTRHSSSKYINSCPLDGGHSLKRSLSAYLPFLYCTLDLDLRLLTLGIA